MSIKKELTLLFVLFIFSNVYATEYYFDNALVADCAGGAETSYNVSARDCSASDGTIALQKPGATGRTFGFIKNQTVTLFFMGPLLIMERMNTNLEQ